MDDEVLDLHGLTAPQQNVASDVLAVVRQRLGHMEVTSDPAADGDWHNQIAKTLTDIENEVYGR